MQTLPVYEYAEITDDGDLFEPERHGPAVPLPDGLLDPSTWSIPRVPRFQRLLADDLSYREAFVAWGAETLGMYEAVWAKPLATELDRAWEVLQLARAKHGFSCLQPQYREVLQPFRDRGMTLRQIAAHVDIPLRDVVMIFMSGRCAPKAEQIADLEEAILDGGLRRESGRKLIDRYGLQYTTLNALCKAHGIVPSQEAKVAA